MAQSPPDWKALYENNQLQEVAVNEQRTPDALFYKGLALARLHRINSAMQALIEGQRSYPSDARFPVELGGLYFQQKDYRNAIRALQSASRLNPADEYTNNFLGSLYLLTGNLDASVKYWNRIGKPVIDNVEVVPDARMNPALLDRAMNVSPRSLLKLDQLKTSEARIESLQVFASPQYTLQAKADGRFDLMVRAPERNGFGNSKAQALLRLFRGLPYWTVYPEYYNAGDKGINITSLLRWDSNKRRAALNVSAPFRSRPSLRYRVFADARDENWVLSPDTASAFGFNSRQYAVGAEVMQTVSGNWKWAAGTTLLHENAPGLSTSGVFATGYSLQYQARVERVLLRIPERRFTWIAKVSPALGRNFGTQAKTFAKAQVLTELNWMPGWKAGDYEVGATVSAGVSHGTLPFGNLFMLGIERDNDLLLRGHPGTRDGKKGSAPLARDYLLGNFDFTRRVFDNGLIDVRLGPFVDVARPWQTLQAGVPSWLVDPGVSLKLRVLGSATVTLSYGRNLHDGRNAFYASALR